MRIAALYDIHGNQPALEAVLREVEREGVEVILIGGDIAWGPFPRETVDHLQHLENATFIRGNADREVAQRLGTADGIDEITADITLWVADQLTNEQQQWLDRLATSFVADVDGIGDVMFCHGSPRSDEEVITPLSPVDRLRTALAEVRERTIVCGHTHMQFERDVGSHHVINAGSVGMPYQREPGAYWALLGPNIEFRRTNYDTKAAATAMKASGCPHVAEAFIETMLHPPPAEEVASHFEAMEAGRASPPSSIG
ncbi:MAG: metallophosphatase family protein [Actinomycetota bacterium]|nr:metallophosphatase family protein [Actinomycetota bacterium]